ncbi:uncharacterized protein LOC142330325 [Lycorma delicatula]|uniref:uncharacterized protein LOC142330325 n=1 Tax=Lycorma delicatula TaxID=130591 RepID=UPI003F512D57
MNCVYIFIILWIYYGLISFCQACCPDSMRHLGEMIGPYAREFIQLHVDVVQQDPRKCGQPHESCILESDCCPENECMMTSGLPREEGIHSVCLPKKYDKYVEKTTTSTSTSTTEKETEQNYNEYQQPAQNPIYNENSNNYYEQKYGYEDNEGMTNSYEYNENYQQTNNFTQEENKTDKSLPEKLNQTKDGPSISNKMIQKTLNETHNSISKLTTNRIITSINGTNPLDFTPTTSIENLNFNNQSSRNLNRTTRMIPTIYPKIPEYLKNMEYNYSPSYHQTNKQIRGHITTKDTLIYSKTHNINLNNKKIQEISTPNIIKINKTNLKLVKTNVQKSENSLTTNQSGTDNIINTFHTNVIYTNKSTTENIPKPLQKVLTTAPTKSIIIITTINKNISTINTALKTIKLQITSVSKATDTIKTINLTTSQNKNNLKENITNRINTKTFNRRNNLSQENTTIIIANNVETTTKKSFISDLLTTHKTKAFHLGKKFNIKSPLKSSDIMKFINSSKNAIVRNLESLGNSFLHILNTTDNIPEVGELLDNKNDTNNNFQNKNNLENKNMSNSTNNTTDIFENIKNKFIIKDNISTSELKKNLKLLKNFYSSKINFKNDLKSLRDKFYKLFPEFKNISTFNNNTTIDGLENDKKTIKNINRVEKLYTNKSIDNSNYYTKSNAPETENKSTVHLITTNKILNITNTTPTAVTKI